MDVFTDKSWVKLNRNNHDYRNALELFLDHSFASSAIDENKIACPCSLCANRNYYERRVVWAQRSKHLSHMPLESWVKLVEHWESREGKDKSERNIVNKSKSKMCHYAGTKPFSRIRAEQKAKLGKEPDNLDIWLLTHVPKKGSHLDDASKATKEAIDEDLAKLAEGSSSELERMKIFKKHVGHDKNGYAKTFGLGVKVSRSHKKRCALEEERAKRIESERKHAKLESKFSKMSSLVKILLEKQGLSTDLLSSDDENDGEDQDKIDNYEEEEQEESDDNDGERRVPDFKIDDISDDNIEQ